MDDFENKFRASMKSKVPLLDRITHYIVKRKGKQMRPMFVFLTAGLCGEINNRTGRLLFEKQSRSVLRIDACF